MSNNHGENMCIRAKWLPGPFVWQIVTRYILSFQCLIQRLRKNFVKQPIQPTTHIIKANVARGDHDYIDQMAYYRKTKDPP